MSNFEDNYEKTLKLLMLSVMRTNAELWKERNEERIKKEFGDDWEETITF